MGILELFHAPAGSFLRHARSRGIPWRIARLLERSAGEACPRAPEQILESRTLFERAAMHAAAGKGGNLELSFRTVDALAMCVEKLGFARASDVPDPFRRVWVRSAKMRRPGVILSCESGEVAVLCPPERRSIADEGSVWTLSYRGFSSTVEYNVRLDDPVRLPRGYIFNLARAEGSGTIGRAQERFSVQLPAIVRRQAPPGGSDCAEPVSCEILDISCNGVRLDCEATYNAGDLLVLDVELPGSTERLAVSCVVRWVRPGDRRAGHGLLFTNLSRSLRERIDAFLAIQRPT